MQDRSATYLRSIIRYCTDISELLTLVNSEYEAYKNNRGSQYAISFCLEQIGELVKKLREQGFFVPEKNELVAKSQNTYLLSVDCVIEKGKIYDGFLKCTYYEDGSFGNIEYNILQLEEYKEFSIISQEEAYKKLQNGEFSYYRKDDTILDVRVQQVELAYELDTKGFYQPVYQFEVIVDDLWTTITIPAIK